MDFNILQTGALLSAGGGILYWLRNLPNILIRKIRNRFIYTVTIYQYDELFNILERWIYANHKAKYRDVEATTDDSGLAKSPYVSRGERPINLYYKQEACDFVIRHGGKRIIISKTKERLDKAGYSFKDLQFRRYIIRGIRAKSVIDDFLQNILKQAIEADKSYIDHYYHNGFGEWHRSGRLFVKDMNQVILPKAIKQGLIDDIEEFTKCQQWYTDRGIPYKRNYLLYGPPGTGKTATASAIVRHLGKDVAALSLNVFDDDEKLMRTIANIPNNCVLVIEDVDKCFSGRETKTGKISFSGFINCLDGLSFKHGLVTVITTNHIDQLDEALLRPGRIDLKLKIDYPGAEEISEYLSLFYGKQMKVLGDYRIPMAKVQAICLQYKSDSRKAAHKLLESAVQFSPNNSTR